jgi:hypothetical protein
MKATTNQIGGIVVDNPNNYFDLSDKQIRILEPLSQINLFVGANNSGKSRLMRRLASQGRYSVKPASISEINAEIDEELGAILNLLSPHKISNLGGIIPEVVKHVRDQLKLDNFIIGEPIYPSEKEKIRTWQPSKTGSIQTGRQVTAEQKTAIAEEAQQRIAKLNRLIESIPDFGAYPQINRVYIPTLRTLRPLDKERTDHFKNVTIHNYFAGVNTEQNAAPYLDIFTGLQFYLRLRRLLLGSTSERRSIEEYQKFLSNHFFEGQPIELTPNEEAETIYVKVGNELERPVHELGDGIQAAIILTFLPLVTESPTFFFIEEPEMYMHPGLQRKLLNTFALLVQHKFFLTTHSNHFLELSTDVKDVSVFTFTKRIDGTKDDAIPDITVIPVNSHCSSSLELLEVRNSSVFLVNSTIWVEGITDRLYLRRFLELYMKDRAERRRLEEDVHFSFVEYGGANIIHWDFLDREEPQMQVDRLCGRALLIVDQDGKRRQKRHDEIKAKIGERLKVIPGREIENLLPFRVISNVVAEYEGSGSEGFRQFAPSDYRDKYLGTFIETELLENTFSRRGGYRQAEGSGTIKDKVSFCDKSMKFLDDFKELSPEVQELTEEIFNFIDSRN